MELIWSQNGANMISIIWISYDLKWEQKFDDVGRKGEKFFNFDGNMLISSSNINLELSKWGYEQEWRKFLSLSWTTFFEKTAFSVVLDILKKKTLHESTRFESMTLTCGHQGTLFVGISFLLATPIFKMNYRGWGYYAPKRIPRVSRPSFWKKTSNHSFSLEIHRVNFTHNTWIFRNLRKTHLRRNNASRPCIAVDSWKQNEFSFSRFFSSE